VDGVSGAESPLFPLDTVLFPGGPLKLRIFEVRYLDMISDCMRNDTGFVVVLLRSGGETGAATFHATGTLAKVVDWDQYDDGLLGITAVGQVRVRIDETRRRKDGLNIGNVTYLPSDPVVPLAESDQYLVRLLEQLMEQLGDQYAHVERHFYDAGWVASRLAEILPLDNDLKQTCLELTQPLERLQIMADVVGQLSRNNN
jgi:Lon protease-like protein